MATRENLEELSVNSQVKKAEHYSLTEIVYGFGSGLTGYLAFEKFIEGRYAIGIACAGASIFCGLMAYMGHRAITNNARELSEMADSYRNELNNAKGDLTFYGSKPETQVEYNDAFQKKAKNLEDLSNDKGAEVLPFKRVLKPVTFDDDPTDPAA